MCDKRDQSATALQLDLFGDQPPFPVTFAPGVCFQYVLSKPHALCMQI